MVEGEDYKENIEGMEKGEELGEARVKLCVSSIQKLT